MRVMLVSPYDFDHPGGVNNHIRHLARQLRRRGHGVTILAPGTASDEASREEGEVRIYRIGRPVPIPSNGSVARISLSPRLARRVRQILGQERPDVIHLHEPFLPALPLTVLHLARTATVGTFHASGSNAGGLVYFYARPILRRFAARLDARIAVSRAARDFVAPYFPGTYRIVPNGVDLERFQARGPGVPELEDGRPTLLFVGRFEEPRKGFRTLLRAYTLLLPEFPELRLAVVGEGSPQAFAHLLPREGEVRFLGRVPEEELPRYYRSATLFCAPSTGGESFGIILVEAQACGAPVAASRIDGYREVIRHGENGWLVRPGDPVAWAVALARLLGDRPLRERLRTGGLRAAQRYDWRRLALEIESIYLETLMARVRRQGRRAEPGRLRAVQTAWAAVLALLGEKGGGR